MEDCWWYNAVVNTPAVLYFIPMFTLNMFVGAFEKLRKTTIGFVMSLRPSVCPSFRMEQIGSHWTDFHEIWYLSIFRKSDKKIKFN